MSRIKQLFQRKQSRVLNIYCTAGFPHLDSTIPVMQALQKNGADIIELGMPYSDPLADGPVIQQSGLEALANGMNMVTLFEQLAGFRNIDGLSEIPVLLMGYMNPVMQYGFEAFCAKASSVGVDGLIIPDLPQFEFETEFGPIIKKYGLDFVFLVTPETSEDRLRQLDERSTGFIYAVSSSSTTGSDKNMGNVNAYLQRLQGMQLKNPVLVGFGIKDKASFDAACTYTNGAIIGTAYIRELIKGGNIEETTHAFLRKVLGR